MGPSRREFLQMLTVAGAGGLTLSGCELDRDARAGASRLYDVPPFGNVSLLHFTDTHAQLLPLYFREPNINIGVGAARGKPPHLVGDALLKFYGVPAQGHRAYAFTYLDFTRAAQRFGKVGGFAHLAALIKSLRDARTGRTLLLDGGDTWQGSATSLWTKGQDMIDAQKLLGVDMMTAHWEFTYGAERVKQVIDRDLKGHIEFLAQNVNDDVWGDPVFKPYSLREVNGVMVAVIGQAFPYTPIANPRYLIPHWTFGIDDGAMQKRVDEVRAKGAQVVVLLSHNGMDVDLKLATRVSGIDAILGGHTHDAVPAPTLVSNAKGKTLVMNSGCSGKFLSVLDLEVKNGRLVDYRYTLLPIFSDLVTADPAMAAHIKNVRTPFAGRLSEKLATTDSLLYRRGNFNGTFDQVILDAMIAVKDAEIAFSPGFRWGRSLLPGDTITMEHVMDQTAITYPTSTVTLRSGAEIKNILEDIADNLFNKDPYYQQGGDMVRVGGLRYRIEPEEDIGRRISNLAVNGKPLDAKKKYKVAGWASIQPQPPGTPIWDVVAQYLRDKKSVRVDAADMPDIKGIDGNPGMARLGAGVGGRR